MCTYHWNDGRLCLITKEVQSCDNNEITRNSYSYDENGKETLVSSEKINPEE